MTDNQRFARVEGIVGPDGLEKLHGSTVVVAGVGNIGGQTLAHLAGIGMNLIAMDRGRVRVENLGNQGFPEDSVGLTKVEARRTELLRINPNLEVDPYHAGIEDLGVGSFRGADLIFCCFDNQRSRVVLNELAVRGGVPWVDAAIDGSGSRFFGRVAAYDPSSSDSPCYVCPHESESLRGIMREDVGPGCPVWRWDKRDDVAPATMAVSALGGVVASIQVLWGLKLLLGQGQDLIGRELYVDLDDHVLTVHRIKRNRSCLLDHQVFSVKRLRRSVQNTTLAKTFAVAESRLGRGVTLELHRRSLVTEIHCPSCSAVKRPYRLLQAMTEAEATCGCGSVMQPVPTGLLDRLRKEQLVGHLDKTWSEFGFKVDDILSFSSGAKQIHFACENK